MAFSLLMVYWGITGVIAYNYSSYGFLRLFLVRSHMQHMLLLLIIHQVADICSVGD